MLSSGVTNPDIRTIEDDDCFSLSNCACSRLKRDHGKEWVRGVFWNG